MACSNPDFYSKYHIIEKFLINGPFDLSFFSDCKMENFNAQINFIVDPGHPGELRF